MINGDKQLEPVFSGIDETLLDELVMNEAAEINEGGAAMIAFARMQFSTMSPPEREIIRE